MDEARDEPLEENHHEFAIKIMIYLEGSDDGRPIKVEECSVFTHDMGEAVITISAMFQREYRKMFSSLRGSLENPERFEKICTRIPVKKNKLYFYNFLKRVSIIYAFAAYSSKHMQKESDDYFYAGTRCIANYPDMKYFDYMGSWECLKYTAAFLAKIGRPLHLIREFKVLKDVTIQTFSEAVERLRTRFMFKGPVSGLDTDEMILLEKLCDSSEANSDPRVKRRQSTTTSDPEAISPGKRKKLLKRSPKEILVKYFEKCLGPEVDYSIPDEDSACSMPSRSSAGPSRSSQEPNSPQPPK